jgi:DNA repair exonuclease SbcCD ATPase subunit
VRD